MTANITQIAQGTVQIDNRRLSAIHGHPTRCTVTRLLSHA